MNLFNRILKLCDKKNINQSDLEKILGFGKGTISKWKNNPNPNAEKILLIADFFNVSTDYLLKGIDDDGLTEKDNRDISKDLENIMSKLSDNDDGPINYDGIELDDETRYLLRDAINLGLRQVKISNKEKYTPNKYKK